MVVRGELYAVGGDGGVINTTSIEKLDKVWGEWREVTELEGEYRRSCGAAAACMGSKIYVFGGGWGNHASTRDFFDVETVLWASASTSSVEHRQLPRGFYGGSALVVPSSTFTYA